MAKTKTMRRRQPPRDAEFGSRIRQLRIGRSFTLQQLSGASGLAISTLSKIENAQISPTYDNIIRLADGLNVDVSVLFSSSPDKGPQSRRSITLRGAGAHINSDQYDYELLCSDLSKKRFLSVIARIKCHNINEFGHLAKHEGEEFLYVISGTVKIFTDTYEPFVLNQGDSCHFDSQMAHACISLGETDAVVLWCYARDYPHDSSPSNDVVMNGAHRSLKKRGEV